MTNLTLKNIDPKVKRQAKSQAALDGKTLTVWIVEAIKEKLERRK
jgi:hypothetical protein